MNSSNFFSYLIYLLMGIMQLLLGIRFVLKIFSPVPSSTFMEWVYTLSDPLIQPLITFFPSTVLNGMFFIELSTMFALIMYTFIGYLMLGIIYKSRKNKKNKKYFH